jgi:uncharacterized protein
MRVGRPPRPGATTGDPVVAQALCMVLACVDPQRVLVFGSRARRQAGPSSDLDLIVVADAGHRQRRLGRELRESLGVLAMPVDVLLVTSAEVARAAPTSFLGSVVTTATVIYPWAPGDPRTGPGQGESAADLYRQRSLESQMPFSM